MLKSISHRKRGQSNTSEFDESQKKEENGENEVLVRRKKKNLILQVQVEPRLRSGMPG